MPLVLVSIIGGTLVSSILITYRVAYYTRLSGEQASQTAPLSRPDRGAAVPSVREGCIDLYDRSPINGYGHA